MKQYSLLSRRVIFPILIVTILLFCSFTNPEYPTSLVVSTNVKRGRVFGRVTTSDGKPLDRVTVSVTGNNQKAVTDFQGTFILKSVPGDAELVFSYVGMKRVRVQAVFGKLMPVQMELATVDLPKTIVRPEDETTTLSVASDEFGVRIKGILDNRPPVFVLDGKEISKSEFNSLNADHIDQISLLKDSGEIKKYGEKGKNGVIVVTSRKIIPTPVAERKVDDILIGGTEGKQEKKFVVTEQMPQFPGGEYRMRYYFDNYIKYPKEAKTAKIEGTVLLSFVVGNTGKVDKIRVLKGVHPSLDKEAIRVVSSMPYWTPGIQNDKPVEVNYTVSIEFSLKGVTN